MRRIILANDDNNGLTIGEDDFLKLKSKEQMCILYRNQVETLKLIRGYKIHQKIQYGTISLLIIGIGYLMQIHLK